MKNVPYKRVDRVNDLIRKIVSEALLGQVHHQGLEAVNVTAVDVSPDFKHAKVYYRVMLDESIDHARLSLIKVLPKIQKTVAKEMHTRYSPTLKFIYDDSLDQGTKIENLLSQIKPLKDSEEE